MKSCVYLIAIFIGVFFFLPAHSAIANITNPGLADEDSDGIIDGWTNNELVHTWWPSGSVQFMPDDQRATNDAFLSQIFTFDPGTTTLSFDGVISVPSETGVFTASLLDPVTHTSLVPSIDGQGHFFSISSEDILAGNDHLDFLYSLDVSGLNGQQVELVFNLNNDYLSVNDSSVILSNLTIGPESVIVPVPGAILLGSIGVGLVGLFRRRKTL